MIWDWVFTIIMYFGSITSIAKLVEAKTAGSKFFELFAATGYLILGNLTLIDIILKIT